MGALQWLGLGRSIPAKAADPRVGIASRHLAPGYSSCGRCRTPWKFVEEHSTQYSPGSGCFPLCQLCWSELTPEERLPFYYVLFRQWEWDASYAGHEMHQTWEQIEQAVLNEGAEA